MLISWRVSIYRDIAICHPLVLGLVGMILNIIRGVSSKKEP